MTVAKRLKRVRAEGSIIEDGSVKRKMLGSTVIGKAKSCVIRAASKRSKYANAFASRLDPLLTSDDLIRYLEATLKLRPTVELVKSANN